MIHTLHNEEMELSVVDPGKPGTYCGTRFSWAGIIREVTWGEHHLFGPWQPGPLVLDVHDNVSGTAGEFGMGIADMPPPLGFDAAGAGDCFIKIGVGILRRPDKLAYEFFGQYEWVETAPWQTEAKQTRIDMRQQLACNDFGYDYTHTIELLPDAPGFVTRHRLMNTGCKPIYQTHYSHNFVVLDRCMIDTNYEITFPFSPAPAFDDNSDVFMDDNRLSFQRALKAPVFAMLDGFKGERADNQVTVRNRKTGLQLCITGDSPIVRYHFFASPGAVCPEPFVPVNAAPGETVTWEYRYELSNNENQ